MGELGPLEWALLPCSCLFFVVWRTLPPGCLKVNFDDSVFSSLSRGGTGFVVRDHDGKLILTTSVPFLDVSVPLAEMITAWNVIKAVIFRIGATKLWIEGDVLGIILATRKGSGPDGNVANLLHDISKTLASDFGRVESITYSSRRECIGRLHDSGRI